MKMERDGSSKWFKRCKSAFSWPGTQTLAAQLYTRWHQRAGFSPSWKLLRITALKTVPKNNSDFIFKRSQTVPPKLNWQTYDKEENVTIPIGIYTSFKPNLSSETHFRLTFQTHVLVDSIGVHRLLPAPGQIWLTSCHSQ